MGRALLIIVSGLFIVYGIIQNTLNNRQLNITEQSTNYAVETKSKTIANSMADLAFAEVNRDPVNDFAGEFDEMDILNGRGAVNIQLVNDPTNPFLVIKEITATGIYDGDTTQVVVRAQRRPFSRYAYFTVVEPTIYFQTGDVLNGPVHTNGTINIDGDPVFNGPVTSPNTPNERSGSDPEYNGGVDFNADEIDLPVEVPDLADAASDGGLRFDNPIKLEFLPDGTASISEGTYVPGGWRCCWSYQPPSYTWSSSTTYNLADYNGIISSSEDIQVEGTLDGDLTIHSEKNIEIMGDIRYKDDPRDNPNSDDFLGIVSEGNTIVDKDAHEANGSDDLDIHASVMALDSDGSFYVEDYNDGESRGRLNLLGGLIQYERGAVGLLSGSGYLKDYRYDQRFLGRSPRGFPASDIYDFISWKTKY